MENDEDGTKVDLSAQAGNKVLPVSDQATSSLMKCEKESTKKGENRKTKALSRMKELLKWAASPKSHSPSKFTEVLHFGNGTTLRVLPNYHPRNDDIGAGDSGNDNESPKISLRWDTESCTASSTSFAISEPCFSCEKLSNLSDFPRQISSSRKGIWITTDSDFVVLELRRD